MSDFERDEQKRQVDVSRHAPRHRMPAGEATMRPVLERLSRGEARDDRRPAESVPLAEPIHARGARVSPKFPLLMTGRLAVSLGLIALLTTVSVTFLQSKAKHLAPTAAADKPKAKQRSSAVDMPKTIHTVTLRPKTKTVARTGLSIVLGQPASSLAQSAPSVADRIEAVASNPPRLQSETAAALTAPLKMWAMFPGEPVAAAPNPAAESADAEDAKVAAPKPAASAPHHRAKARRHVRRHRRHYARHHSRRHRRHTARIESQPAREQASATQPVKNAFIQAAMDSIFGDGGGSASESVGTAASGAAFR